MSTSKSMSAIHGTYGDDRQDGHKGAVHSVSITDDDRMLLTCSEDGTAKLWDRRSGRCVRTYVGHTRGVRDGAMGLPICYGGLVSAERQ